MFSVDYNLVYDKTTVAEGREFWVYAPFPTSVSPTEKNHFTMTISPNPVQDKIWMSFPDKNYLNSKIKIHNVTGQEIMSGVIQNRMFGFDVRNFDPSIYFLEIVYEKGKSAVGSFVKQ